MEILSINKYVPKGQGKENHGYILDLKNATGSFDSRDNPQNAIDYFVKTYNNSDIKEQIESFCAEPGDVKFCIIPSSDKDKPINCNHIQIGSQMFNIPHIMIFTLNENLSKQTHNSYSDRFNRQTEVENKVELSNNLAGVSRIVLLDDVVTTGQTFSAFKQKILDSYPNIEILCVALSRTERENYDID